MRKFPRGFGRFSAFAEEFGKNAEAGFFLLFTEDTADEAGRVAAAEEGAHKAAYARGAIFVGRGLFTEEAHKEGRDAGEDVARRGSADARFLRDVGGIILFGAAEEMGDDFRAVFSIDVF